MSDISISTVSTTAIPKNSADEEVLVNLYGTYTGLTFAFEFSVDGSNGWAPLAVRSTGSNAWLSGSISPVDSSSVGYRVPCEGVYVRINTSAISTGSVSGNVKSESSPQAPITVVNLAAPSSLTVANGNLATVGAGTLTAALLVGGYITRSGSTAAYTDTTDTAAAIIAAITNAAVNQSFLCSIKNTVNFNQTLAAGTGVTLAGQVIIPPNCTGTFLVTITGSTTVTVRCMYISENCPLPNAKLTSINATTGSLAAGAATGARTVYLTSTNAVPGAQLVRTAAQMLADIPNGVIGTSWTLVITNTGAGTLTLTTDAGATVTMNGTMTVPQNTTRTFYVTILTATTASVTAQDVGTYS